MRLAGLALVGLSLTAGACSEVYVEDTPLCLTWEDAEQPADLTEITQLDCHVFRKLDEPAIDPQEQFPGVESHYQYACVDPHRDGGCPAPEEVRGILNDCFGAESGSANPVGGYHETTRVYSACGPDPVATGACCYHTFFITSGYISAIGTGAQASHA